MTDQKNERQCLLLDSWNHLLAGGRLESPMNAPKLQVQVLGEIEMVLAHEVIQVVSVSGDDRPLKCRLAQHRNDRIVLETLEVLDPEIRHNLRVPVRFESFIYPLDGVWKGRRTIQSIDLSCGGIAFYAEAGLRVGERLEVVVPITEQPIIASCEILRVRELQHGRTLYAAKFVDMCNDEEKTLRRAVFGIQIRNGQARNDGGETR